MFILTKKGYTNMKKSGFTLIELLIVIGLLAALAAVLLPTLMGDRQTATESICNYNQAGTLRTLRQYEAMTSGKLPSGLHTGLNSDATSYMTGMPAGFTRNLSGAITAYTTTLDSAEQTALSNVGITKLAYGEGNPAQTGDVALGYNSVGSLTLPVMQVKSTWLDDGDSPYSFNGKGIDALAAEGYKKVIALFITPTTDWEASESQGWVKGFSVKLDVPGKCPVPVDADFAYYVAYIGLQTGGYNVKFTPINSATLPGNLPTWSENDSVDPDDLPSGYEFDGDGDLVVTGDTTKLASVAYEVFGSPKAVLLGTSCPECGITNP
jgi:prepilin-type N-terminal cleavage/methylation domain-containing protein